MCVPVSLSPFTCPSSEPLGTKAEGRLTHSPSPSRGTGGLDAFFLQSRRNSLLSMPANGYSTLQVSLQESTTQLQYSWGSCSAQAALLLHVFVHSSASLVSPRAIQGLKSRILFKGSIKANKLLKIHWHPICCQAGNLSLSSQGTG